MRMTSGRNHPLRRILKTGMAAVTLLLLGACATAPVKVIPPSQAALPPALQSTLPPVSLPAEMQTAPPLPTAETATTPLAVSSAPPLTAALSVEPVPVASPAQAAYIPSFASYYAKRFEGRRTATGERYDPKLMTAATRDFPLHSWLKVINPANGKEVIVRVNDRTGKRKTPLVDLSRAAAKELDFLGKGKIRVQVILVPPVP